MTLLFRVPIYLATLAIKVCYSANATNISHKLALDCGSFLQHFYTGKTT